MYTVFLHWTASLKHVFSLPFLREVACRLYDVRLCIASSLMVFSFCVFLSCWNGGGISHFFHAFFSLMPPFVALMVSPLYVPFLVHIVQRAYHSASSRLTSFRWAIMMYLFVFGAVWMLDYVVMYGPTIIAIMALSALMLSTVFMVRKIVAFPVASVAALFPPARMLSYRMLWRHAQRMTWNELPGIMMLWCITMPFAYGFYFLIKKLFEHEYITKYIAYCLLHGVNIFFWQIGWVAFMVFYQQRKNKYFE